jgi:hypothetical protein
MGVAYGVARLNTGHTDEGWVVVSSIKNVNISPRGRSCSRPLSFLPSFRRERVVSTFLDFSCAPCASCSSCATCAPAPPLWETTPQSGAYNKASHKKCKTTLKINVSIRIFCDQHKQGVQLLSRFDVPLSDLATSWCFVLTRRCHNRMKDKDGTFRVECTECKCKEFDPQDGGKCECTHSAAKHSIKEATPPNPG